MLVLPCFMSFSTLIALASTLASGWATVDIAFVLRKEEVRETVDRPTVLELCTNTLPAETRGCVVGYKTRAKEVPSFLTSEPHKN